MATLLPNGKQQFIDGNGDPLAGGSVTFCIPGTLDPKDTWRDSGQTTLNTNPVTLDASGEAIIYGSGSYRQIVKDADGNTIWDQLTADTAVGGLAWGGSSTGTANAQIIAASSFSQQDGQEISFIAGYTNTGALTVAPGGGSGIPVLLDGVTGPVPCSGGEVVEDNAVTLIYDAARGAFHIVQNNAYNLVVAGAIVPYAMSTPPTGWLEANGASLLRSQYPHLFSAIGTIYGSADGTHFTLPDLRGYFVRGWDDGRGVDSGRAFGSNQTGANLAHIHTASFAGDAMSPHNHSWQQGNTGTGAFNLGTNSNNISPTTGSTSAGTPTGTVTVNSSGSESRPVNVALLYCIKY